MPDVIPLRQPDDHHNARLMAEARAALDALLAQATRRDGRFYGKIAIEVTVQSGVLCHVKETIERTRK